MSEHLANGQFAAKEVSENSAPVRKKCKPRGRPFAKGNPGKPPGTQNKLTRDVKEFLAALVASQRVQEAVEARIEKGDAVAFFRALEHVLGKPKENVDLNITGSIQVEQRLVSGRQRVAAARGK